MTNQWKDNAKNKQTGKQERRKNLAGKAQKIEWLRKVTKRWKNNRKKKLREQTGISEKRKK